MGHISNEEFWYLQTHFLHKEKYIAYKIIKENYGSIKFEDVFKFIRNSIANLNKEYENALEKINDTKIENKNIISFLEIEQLRKKSLQYPHFLALEYKGNKHLLAKKNITIIGSRKPTYYGRLLTSRYTKELTSFGYGVLSGGAIGIDTIANKVGFEDSGTSIVILGSGLNHLYPPANEKLFKKMSVSQNGLILSEFATNLQAQKWTFPQRNMTIALLSDFVLVVEAAKTSGSLMTAQFATDFNIDVGAVPGNVHNPNTEGTHALIAKGALCVHNTHEIVDSVGLNKN